MKQRGGKNVHGLAEAKAKLSELVERARSEGPQQITVHKRPAAYLVSAEEWKRRTQPKESLYEFFRRSPLYGSGIRLERNESGPRDVDL
jgi:prevent-host-death family protein